MTLTNHAIEPEAGSVESFLQYEAIPAISTMRTLFKAIKAMTKDSTIAELASHGTYLGDAMHDEIDVVRGDLREARKPLLLRNLIGPESTRRFCGAINVCGW